MSAHTPGPWKAIRRGVGHAFVSWPKRDGWQAEAPFVVAGRHEWQIYGDDWKHGKEHEQKGSGFIPANAYLIAASPELLDALRELVAAGEFAVSSEDDVAIMLRLGKATDDARAAIAKAEGRA